MSFTLGFFCAERVGSWAFSVKGSINSLIFHPRAVEHTTAIHWFQLPWPVRTTEVSVTTACVEDAMVVVQSEVKGSGAGLQTFSTVSSGQNALLYSR